MSEDSNTQAFREGRQAGLAVAAVAMSAIAFVSLLGLEKAILAAALALLARRGTVAGSHSRRLARLALAIAILYALTFVAVMALYHEKLAELIRLLQHMG